MALDAVIFDVDGTLIDTNDAHVRTWQAALKSCGFEVPADRIAPEIGKGSDTFLPAILGPASAKKYKKALDEAYGREFLALAAHETFQIFPGARELMDVLHQRGLRVAIATSAKQEYLEAIEKSSGFRIEEVCDELVTSSDAEKSKPAPDIVLATLDKLKLSPAQCMMVGDTPHDAESCRQAGVVCLGVLTGGHAADEMKSSGARHVYRDVAELLEQLDDALQIASPGKIHLSNDALEKLMREALQTAEESMKNGEVPIGCVLADGDGKVVARGYNEMNGSQNKTAHAEIVTFAHAAGKVPVDARDLILVSTLEPCVMCTGAAMEAAIDTIVYAMRAPADSGTGRVQSPASPESQMPRIVGDILANESRTLFERWLRDNSDTPQAAFVKQLLELTE